MNEQLAAVQRTSLVDLLRSMGWGANIGVAVFIAVTIFHVASLVSESVLSYPSKLLLMPALLYAAGVISSRFQLWPKYRAAMLLLFAGVLASWLGDGAAVFYPGLPELPMMMVSFGVAHLCYIIAIWRTPGVASTSFPRFALLYVVAYAALMVVLLPNAGDLRIAVMVYGLLLVATAVMTARCGVIVAFGGASFLISDALLSFRIFIPEVMPTWTNSLVMLTYSVGQGLIVLGIFWRLSQHPRIQS